MENNILKFDLSPKQIKYKDILNKEFIELEVWAISTINPNRNNSHFTLESLQDALPNCKNKPIVGFFENNDFTTHEGKTDYDMELDNEFWNTERGERILGWIRESDPVEIVEENGLYWLKFRCVLCTTYCYRQVRRLLKDKRKKVSVEITVKEHEYIDGIEQIKKFVLNGVTILGSKNGKAVLEGIPGAHLSILENLDEAFMAEQKRVLTFAYTQLDGKGVVNEDNKIVKDAIGLGEENTKKEENQADMDNTELNNNNIETYGINIKVDKSKEAISDKPWGEVDKTELRRKVVEADNFKTVAKDIFLDLREGWEDGEVSKLKYPVMELKDDNTAVYNRGGLASAKAYAEQHDEEEVLQKVKKIYEDLDLNDSDEDKEQACKLCVECKEDYCNDCDGCEDNGDDDQDKGFNNTSENNCDNTHIQEEYINPENNQCINEGEKNLNMENIDLGIPQCTEDHGVQNINENGDTVIVDPEAPKALIPDDGMGLVVSNDDGIAKVVVKADEDGDNKGNINIKCDPFQCECDNFKEKFEELEAKYSALEITVTEKEGLISKYEEQINKYSDYEDIKQRLEAAEQKLFEYRCAELEVFATDLMSEENIKAEYYNSILGKCKNGEYSCEDDIKTDVAIAIYSSRPVKEKRFSVSIPVVEPVMAKSEKKPSTPAERLKNYANK